MYMTSHHQQVLRSSLPEKSNPTLAILEVKHEIEFGLALRASILDKPLPSIC
jgi:hypothetical protein